MFLSVLSKEVAIFNYFSKKLLENEPKKQGALLL